MSELSQKLKEIRDKQYNKRPNPSEDKVMMDWKRKNKDKWFLRKPNNAG